MGMGEWSLNWVYVVGCEVDDIWDDSTGDRLMK